jgi:hypothetical protein
MGQWVYFSCGAVQIVCVCVLLNRLARYERAVQRAYIELRVRVEALEREVYLNQIKT